MGKHQWAFIMDRFKKLQSGEIAWDSIREYVKEREDLDHCVYCGKEETLTLEHLFPRAFRGPEDEKNAVWACASCNSAKGARRLYEFWAEREGLKAAKYNVPRLAEGKYLKLLYDVFDAAGVLDLDEGGLQDRFCSGCDLNPLCHREDSVGTLSPLCLDGVATTVLRSPAG